MFTQIQLQKMAETLWAEYCEVFPKLVKFDCPKLTINNRFTKTAGCNYTDENEIHLAGKFLAKFEQNMLNVILPHELAHQIDFNLNGWHKGKLHHGKTWVVIMVKLGQNPDPYHSMVL